MRSLFLPLILGLVLISATVVCLTTPYYFLAPLPAIGSMLVFALWQRPIWGFLLILFFIPFDQYRSLSSQLEWFTISKVIGALLVLLLIAQWLVLHRPLPLRSKLWPLLGLFVAGGAISLLFTDYPATTLSDLRQLVTAIVFFGLTLCLVEYRQLFTSIPKAIVLGVTCSALLSLYGYISADPMFAVTTNENMTRAIGGANDPNMFSVSLLFALPILVHYIFESPSPMGRLMAGVLAVVNILALIATFSRGGFLNFAALSILLFIEHHKRLEPRKIGLIIAGVLAMILLVFAFSPASYWERQRSIVKTTSDESISRRLDYIKIGWDKFCESPLIGHGPGTFKELWAQSVYEGTISKGPSKGFERRAHNTYIEILVGNGILGLAFYLFFIFTALHSFRQAQCRLLGQERGLEASMTGAYKLSFISILLYFFILSAPTHKFFWVALAFSQIILHGSQENPEEPV